MLTEAMRVLTHRIVLGAVGGASVGGFRYLGKQQLPESKQRGIANVGRIAYHLEATHGAWPLLPDARGWPPQSTHL